MSIHFTHGRLHVGFRRRDWGNVWYDPIGDADDEGEAPIALYTLPRGNPGRREPMEGEVAWHPFFDPVNCESKALKERDKLQKQTLVDCHMYMAEKNLDKIREMEEEFEDRAFARQYAWFQHAKKAKKRQTSARKDRRAKRTETAKITDFGDGEMALNSDSSDSAYESISEKMQRGQRRALTMPPPPRPRQPSFTSKRKAAGGAANGQKKNAKKPHSSLDRLREDFRRQQQSPPRMSGGLGSRAASAASASQRSAITNHDDDELSQDWDGRAPEAMDEEEDNGNNAATNGGGAGSLETPPSTALQAQEDGNNILPFADWGRRGTVDGLNGVVNQYNGFMNDDEALREGLRNSMPPSVEPEQAH